MTHIALVAFATLAALLDPPRVGLAGWPHQQQPLPLLRLSGGTDDAAPITVRVRTKDGLKRATLPSADATLADLEKALRQEHRVSVQPGMLSRGPSGAEPLSEADAECSLRELGIAHGAMLHLTATASAPSPPASATTDRRSGGSARSRRKKHTSMADFEAERAQFEVVLDTPKAASCSYVAVERLAAKRFSDYLLDTEFEARRMALLFGRWEEASVAGGKSGVQVDVVYEPPQTVREAERKAPSRALGCSEPRLRCRRRQSGRVNCCRTDRSCRHAAALIAAALIAAALIAAAAAPAEAPSHRRRLPLSATRTAWPSTTTPRPRPRWRAPARLPRGSGCASSASHTRTRRATTLWRRSSSRPWRGSARSPSRPTRRRKTSSCACASGR